MKLVTISDIHGRGDWVHVDAANYDLIIFLGDYVDSHSLSDGVILSNFQQIIKFKQRYPEKVVLLLGNHDAQYRHFPNYSCSGFRWAMQPTLTSLFQENQSLFRIAHQEGDYLFTHAGVTNGWLAGLRKQAASAIPALNHTATLADGLNKVYRDAEYQPILFEVAPVRGGDAPFSGPVWADRSETRVDYLKGVHQIVGHTPTPEFLTVGDESGSITYTDVLGYERAFYEAVIPD